MDAGPQSKPMKPSGTPSALTTPRGTRRCLVGAVEEFGHKEHGFPTEKPVVHRLHHLIVGSLRQLSGYLSRREPPIHPQNVFRLP